VALPGDGEVYNQDDTIVVKGNAGLHDILAAAGKSLGKWGMQDGSGYWGT